MRKRYKKQLLFELSGEHPELPYAELDSVLNMVLEKKVKSIIKTKDRIMIVDTDDSTPETINAIGSRLAMCHSINELIGRSSIDTIGSDLDKVKNCQIKENETFKLTTKRLHKIGKLPKEDLTEVKNRIIRKFLDSNGKVNVKSPDVELMLFVGTELYLAKKILNIHRSAFETRKPQLRPFFAPISLHPRLARCLVNLAGLHKNELLLDPFCGTGGILLEAGLMGNTVFGADIDPKMITGTKKNLLHWGINDFTIIKADINELPDQFTSSDSNYNSENGASVQPAAIVTEPPYGRATTTAGEPIESLLARAFRIFNKILKPNGRVVISLPDLKFKELANEYFELVNMFKIHVHRSLTKYILVLQRKS